MCTRAPIMLEPELSAVSAARCCTPGVPHGCSAVHTLVSQKTAGRVEQRPLAAEAKSLSEHGRETPDLAQPLYHVDAQQDRASEAQEDDGQGYVMGGDQLNARVDELASGGAFHEEETPDKAEDFDAPRHDALVRAQSVLDTLASEAPHEEETHDVATDSATAADALPVDDEAQDVGEVEEEDVEEVEEEEETGRPVAQGASFAEDAPGEVVSKPKRAVTPWALWLASVHGGKPSKAAGEAWRALSDEERAPWIERAAIDKKRHNEELVAYKAALARGATSADAQPVGTIEVEDGHSALPIAVVRRAMKAAKADARSATREGTFLISKASELVLGMLCEQAAEHAVRERRKTLTLHDIGRVIYGSRSADLFAFLHDDLTRKLTLERAPRTVRGPMKPRAPREPAVEGLPTVASFCRSGGAPPAAQSRRSGNVDFGAETPADEEGLKAELPPPPCKGRSRGRPASTRATKAAPKPTKPAVKSTVLGRGSKRSTVDAVQSKTMTSFFTKQSGAWQPREEDFAAPADELPMSKPARRERKARRRAGGNDEEPVSVHHDHDGLASRLAAEEAEFEKAEVAAAANAAGRPVAKRRRIMDSDDEEEEAEADSEDELLRPSRAEHGRGAAKQSEGNAQAGRKRMVVESDEEEIANETDNEEACKEEIDADADEVEMDTDADQAQMDTDVAGSVEAEMHTDADEAD